MGKPDLKGYVDVAERLAKFHERYPEGSLQGDFDLRVVGEQLFLIYRAEAYRTPDDPRPGIGYAWEPVPGVTPYTKGSELMVGETSAWGRALAALGFEVHRGIASAQEVANRSDDAPREASAKQKRAITVALNKAGVARDFQREIVHKIAGEPPSAKGASQILDVLFDDEAGTPQVRVTKLLEMAELSWPSDVPADEDGLPEPEERDDEGTVL